MGGLLARSIVAALPVGLGIFAYVGPERYQPPPGTETWLFFDGVCNLCDGFVNFVYWGDSAGRVKFGALQKHTDLLRSKGAGRYAEGGEEELSTVVVIQGDDVYVRSAAALRVLAVMDQPWRTLSVFMLLPEALRNRAYKLVGENRYKLFGQKEECMEPSGDFSKRFLEYDPTFEDESPFRQAR